MRARAPPPPPPPPPHTHPPPPLHTHTPPSTHTLHLLQWLWDIVKNEMELTERKMFLKFFTGSDRSPIGGLGSLKVRAPCCCAAAVWGRDAEGLVFDGCCRRSTPAAHVHPPLSQHTLHTPRATKTQPKQCIIQRDGPDSNKLPTSHTCFNTLLLPEYVSPGKMADMLKLAVMNSEGFGLE